MAKISIFLEPGAGKGVLNQKRVGRRLARSRRVGVEKAPLGEELARSWRPARHSRGTPALYIQLIIA